MLAADASALMAALVDSGHEGKWAESGIAAGHVAGPELVLAEATNVWALRGDLTSYDAWYVALAETLNCPLLTLDRRLSRAAGPGCAFACRRSSATV